jgi:lipopolysaccharide exporter
MDFNKSNRTLMADNTLKKSLGSNIAKLLTSKIAAQASVFISAPIITRLFSPDGFGILQIFMSVTAILAIITCLRYELSIPLAKNDKEANASFVLCMGISLVFNFIVFVIVTLGKVKICQWFGVQDLNIFLRILPVTTFLMGLRYSLGYWTVRQGKFGEMAWSDFSSALSGRFFTIIWAVIIGASATGLLIGYFGGVIVGILMLLVFFGRKLVSQIKHANLSFEVLLTIAKRYKKFALFETWSGLVNNISRQLPPILLGLYYSTTVVGYYSLGYRLISFPLMLLGNSVSQVFFPTAAEEYNSTGKLSNIVSGVFKRLVQVGVFPFVALGFVGAPLFGFVFGQEWIEAGIYVQILSLYIFIQFIFSPLSTTFAILQRQETGLILNIGMIISRTIALLLGAKIGGARIALVLYSIVSMVNYSIWLRWILHNSGVSLRWGIKILLKYIGLSCLLLLPSGGLVWGESKIIFIFISTGLATIAYIGILYKIDLTFRNIITNKIFCPLKRFYAPVSAWIFR